MSVVFICSSAKQNRCFENNSGHVGVWDFTSPLLFTYFKHCEDNYVKKKTKITMFVITKAIFLFVSGSNNMTVKQE